MSSSLRGAGRVRLTSDRVPALCLPPSEALVEYDYEAQHTDELTIRVGDVVTDLAPTEPGWMRGKLRGKVGVFPDNFVKVGRRRRHASVW